MVIVGWKYWYRRILGWLPIQPCIGCRRWYWGGWPMTGWRPWMKEYCSKACYDKAEWW